jgi:enoyl-CoA hydratase/carnithine racemase
MQFRRILFEVTDSVATTDLNRPDSLNSVVAQMPVDLRRALNARSDAGQLLKRNEELARDRPECLRLNTMSAWCCNATTRRW